MLEMLYSLNENQLAKLIVDWYKSIGVGGNMQWMFGRSIDQNNIFGQRKRTDQREVDITPKAQ